MRYNLDRLGDTEPKIKTEVLKMNSKENLPMMLSANEIQTMGFTRNMAYSILDREDVPVVKIGSRKFIQRDKFFEWLDSREKLESKNNDRRTEL